MRTDEEPVVVEQTYAASVEDVWSAITQRDQMVQWYFDNIPSFEAAVGFETRFDVECEGRVFPHLWKVTDVVPQQRIQYDWRYDGYSGDGFVVFELAGQGEETKLTLTCRTREDFPDDIPEFRRESCEAGWKYFIQENLKRYLESAD